jgi:hypothetical protein
MKTACKGSRNQSIHGAKFPRTCGSADTAIKMLAGNTAIKSAMSPHPAAVRSRRTSSPIPPAISHTPLIKTSALGSGNPGGMMFR